MKKKITETTSFKECMALLPYYIGALVLLGIVSVILMISGIGDYTLLTGAVAGTAVSALNFVLMALAGADRIFDLLDEPEEVDQGKVTLVNYELVDGQMVVTDKKTNLWAWKHPRPNGDYELVKMVGNVVFDDVDFCLNYILFQSEGRNPQRKHPA